MDNGHRNIQIWAELARKYTNERRYGAVDRDFEVLIDRVLKASMVAARFGMDYVVWGMLQKNLCRGLSMGMAMFIDGSGGIAHLTRMMTAHSIDSRNRELWDLVGGGSAGLTGRALGAWGASPENELYREAAARMETEVIRYSMHVLNMLQEDLGDGVKEVVRKEYLRLALDDTRTVFCVLVELAPPAWKIRLCGIFYKYLHAAKELNPSDKDEYERIFEVAAVAERTMLCSCEENL